MKISMKLVCQNMVIFFNFSLTLNHLYPLHVENCESNSRLVLGEDDNGKFRLERVKGGWELSLLLKQFHHHVLNPLGFRKLSHHTFFRCAK